MLEEIFDSSEKTQKDYDYILSKLNNLRPKLQYLLKDSKYSLIDYKLMVESINKGKVMDFVTYHVKVKFFY